MSREKEFELQVTVLLDAMNREIRQARFGKCLAISAELETVFTDLPNLDPGCLARIRALARRNADCLEAAAQGLRAGRRRLTEIAAAGRADTYDRKGARQTLPVETMGRRL